MKKEACTYRRHIVSIKVVKKNFANDIKKKYAGMTCYSVSGLRLSRYLLSGLNLHYSD